jgi:hypothetical protein
LILTTAIFFLRAWTPEGNEANCQTNAAGRNEVKSRIYSNSRAQSAAIFQISVLLSGIDEFESGKPHIASWLSKVANTHQGSAGSGPGVQNGLTSGQP